MATRTFPDRKAAPPRETADRRTPTPPAVGSPTAAPATTVADGEPTIGSRAGAQFARSVTAMFLAVPLVAAAFGAGEPSRLITLSGATALFLALDVLLERIGRPIAPTPSLGVAFVAWLAGLALLGNAGQTNLSGYHGEAATVVAVIAAAFVATICPRPTALLWTLSAAAAVGFGASLAGAPTPGMAMAVCAVGFGAVMGLLLGVSLDGQFRVPVPR